MILSIVLTLLSVGVVSCAFVAEEIPENTPGQKYFHVKQKVVDNDGKTIEKVMIVGPPSPPVGYERRSIVPEPDQEGRDTDSSTYNLLKERE